jgi:diguanylate cyclase (GGDEF)-like protein
MQAYHDDCQNPGFAHGVSGNRLVGPGADVEGPGRYFRQHDTGPSVSSLDDRRSQGGPEEDELQSLRKQVHELKERVRKLSLLNLTDEVTGLRNKRRFHQDLESVRAHAIRHNLQMSLIMLEFDDFESLWSDLGQEFAKQVLRSFAVDLTATLRQYDVVARLDGGRICVLLPSADHTEARGVAERIRKGIEDRAWGCRALTASLGVVSPQSSTTSACDLIDQGQQTLEAAQRRGGNHIESSLSHSSRFT